VITNPFIIERQACAPLAAIEFDFRASRARYSAEGIMITDFHTGMIADQRATRDSMFRHMIVTLQN
jgi:hypothetical protein